MDNEIRWSAPEYHYYDKGIAWYWLVIIAAIIIGTLALLQKNFLFIVFIAIASALGLFWGHRQPKTVNFILNQNGLDIDGKKFYAFESLVGFSLLPSYENSEINELAIKTKEQINGWIKIIIASQRAEQISEFLKRNLQEIEYQESMAEHIARILKF